MNKLMKTFAITTAIWVVCSLSLFFILNPNWKNSVMKIVISNGDTNTLPIGLIWNVFLAIIPVFFAICFSVITAKFQKRKDAKNKALLCLTGVLWLLFWPNSVYMITDLRYAGFMNFNGASGSESPLLWLELLNLGGAVILGVTWGMLSLETMITEVYGKIRLKILRFCLISLFVLSGYAIFLGRILRINSYDFFMKFDKILANTFQLNTLIFIVIFAIMSALPYGLWRLLRGTNVKI